MMIEKHVQRKLMKVVEDPEKGKYAEYVLMVLSGSKKGEALKEVFPDRHARAIERSAGNSRVIGANVKKEISQIERTKVCKELFEQSHKTWWISFLDKKHALYENLYGMAVNDDVSPRDRVAASKVMLEHMPSFQEDINVKVEVKQSKDDFVTELRSMQKKLHTAANQDAIDIEVLEVVESK
jgi:hypothetical protein